MTPMTSNAGSQEPPRYGPPISLESAKAVMAAAEAEAEKNGWRMVIAIVDSAGRLVMLHRLDDAQHGSIRVARLKAETAARFKRPTKVFEDALAAGGLNLRLLSMPGLLPVDGGLPLAIEGEIVGAIGVSGMLPTQDAQVAAAGAAALR